MSTSCKSCSPGCVVIAVVTSLIAGIVASFLRITGAISLTPAFLWVLLGIAVVYLAVAFAVSALSVKESCNDLCCTVTALIAGIIGTILLSIVFLAIEFAATSVIGAILTGALLFFFFLIVTSTACLIRCFFNCNG